MLLLFKCYRDGMFICVGVFFIVLFTKLIFLSARTKLLDHPLNKLFFGAQLERALCRCALLIFWGVSAETLGAPLMRVARALYGYDVVDKNIFVG